MLYFNKKKNIYYIINHNTQIYYLNPHLHSDL